MAVKKTATKKATPKKSSKITLADNILWAVVKRTWLGSGTKVMAVFPTKAQADTEAANCEAVFGGDFVVQRAELFDYATK